MNKSNSGAIACGFGLSKIRYRNEIDYYIDENKEGDLHGFLQTDEGKKLGREFTIKWGGGNNPELSQIGRYCQMYKSDFETFLSGFRSATFEI